MAKRKNKNYFTLDELKKHLYENFYKTEYYCQYVKAGYYNNKSDSKPYLYFSKPDNFNDSVDANSLKNVDNLTFVACLCRSKVENIHMWLMYAPYGFRLTFPKSFIKTFAFKKSSKSCSSLSIELNDSTEMRVSSTEFVKYGFKIESSSIAYLTEVKKDADGFVRYSGLNRFGTKYDLETLFSDNWFFKSDLWRDEMEARIIITVPKSFLNDKNINPNSIKGLKITTNNRDGFKVIRSPIVGNLDFYKDYGLEKELMGIYIDDSGFKGTVNFGNEETNPKSIVQKIDQKIEKPEDKDWTKIKDLIYKISREERPDENK